MTFGDWRSLKPSAAASSLADRMRSALEPAQRAAAIAFESDEEVLQKAFASAAEGPLKGIPFLVKDLYDVQGMPTRAGSSFLSDVRPVPEVESTLVRDLRALGAVVAGKTHLFEFAWGLTGENAFYGDCERPGFPGRTSGGSSSGSAAAVAAGIVPLALATDTGGSVRVPAAFCGVWGYRGVPRDPRIADAVPLAPSFDTAGWFTSSAQDLLEATHALMGLEPAVQAPRGLYLEMPELDAEVADACRKAAARIAPTATGAVRDELLARFAPAAETYGVLAGSESWKLHRRWADRNRARYGPLLQERLERARAISPAQVAAVEPSLAAIKAAWSGYFAGHDFLVMASAPFAALRKADCTQANRLRMLALTAPASLGGYAAVSVPVTLPSGLTAGLQVILSRPTSPAMAWVLGNYAG